MTKRDKIKELLAEGELSQSDIARFVGCTRQYVSLVANGKDRVKGPKPGGTQRNQAVWDAVVACAEAHPYLSQERIAELTGASSQTHVSRILRASGVTKPHAPRTKP